MAFKSDRQRKKVMSQYKAGKDYFPVGRDKSLPISDKDDESLLRQIRGMRQVQKDKDEYNQENRGELTDKQLNFLRNKEKDKVIICRKCGSEIVKGTTRCPHCYIIRHNL